MNSKVTLKFINISNPNISFEFDIQRFNNLFDSKPLFSGRFLLLPLAIYAPKEHFLPLFLIVMITLYL